MDHPVETIEIRCPVGPQRLFSKVLRRGEKPTVTDNLIEFACADCKLALQRKGERVKRILHRFDLAGELVESVIERGGR